MGEESPAAKAECSTPLPGFLPLLRIDALSICFIVFLRRKVDSTLLENALTGQQSKMVHIPNRDMNGEREHPTTSSWVNPIKTLAL
jgi:hypothetical protein